MGGDLDVTEAVILDHITAILYVGWRSAGEGLTEEEAQALMLNGGAWQSNGNSKPSHWLRVKKRSKLMKLKARRPSEGVGDLELLSLQPPWLKVTHGDELLPKGLQEKGQE